jgi:hypothetical protein
VLQVNQKSKSLVRIGGGIVDEKADIENLMRLVGGSKKADIQ